MRTLLLLSLLVLAATDAFGQGPAPPRAAATPAQPAQPAHRALRSPRAAPAARKYSRRHGDHGDRPARRNAAGIRVEVTGPHRSKRRRRTRAGRSTSRGCRPGTYRLRFSGDEVITLEREVTIRAGQVADVDVTLNSRASSRVVERRRQRHAAGRGAAPAPPVGPTGTPQTLSVPDLLEKNFVGSQPRRETVLSCSGNTRSTMIQLNAALPERLYETADATYYVIGGEGVVRIAGRETKLATNGFVSVPRGTAHTFVRSGRRPLILLAVLSGEPCEQAK